MQVILPWPELAPRVAALVGDIDVEVWTERSPQLPAGSLLCLPHPAMPWQLAALASSTGLLGLQVLSSGVDHLRGCVPVGVPVFRAPHFRGAATAELGVTLILMSVLGAAQWGPVKGEGKWLWLPPAGRLRGLQVLVLGRGEVGAGIQRAMSALGARVVVLGWAPVGIGRAALAKEVTTADVVVLALPLTADTWHLFDETMLDAVKAGALLVNVARGGLVDTPALVARLMAGQISAALDVVDPEPLPVGHPLWSCPNLILSPHVGGNVSISEEALAAFIAEQAVALHDGLAPRYRVEALFYDW